MSPLDPSAVRQHDGSVVVRGDALIVFAEPRTGLRVLRPAAPLIVPSDITLGSCVVIALLASSVLSALAMIIALVTVSVLAVVGVTHGIDRSGRCIGLGDPRRDRLITLLSARADLARRLADAPTERGQRLLIDALDVVWLYADPDLPADDSEAAAAVDGVVERIFEHIGELHHAAALGLPMPQSKVDLLHRANAACELDDPQIPAPTVSREVHPGA